MFGLVIVIIGIAVFSLFMAAGSNYIDGDKMQASQIKASLQGAVSQYAAGVVQFNLIFKKNPAAISNISPSLIDPPRMPDGFAAVSISQYTVPSVGERLGVCFVASSVAYPSYLALSSLKDQYPDGQIRIVDDCANITEIAAPISYPASFYFIHLIKT